MKYKKTSLDDWNAQRMQKLRFKYHEKLEEPFFQTRMKLLSMFRTLEESATTWEERKVITSLLEEIYTHDKRHLDKFLSKEEKNDLE